MSTPMLNRTAGTTRRRLLQAAAAAPVLLAAATCRSGEGAPRKRPNILLIMGD